jgi:hypothetical protein
MAKRTGDQLQRGDRVLAADGIVGVPDGTPGRVETVSGFRWIRYRVQFDNGENIGSLDRAQLTHVDRRGQPVEGATR